MTTSDLQTLTLQLAGQEIRGGWDRLCRYCGLEWSGGPAETWAYRYYDTVETDPNTLTPVDVLATAALHPGISRDDLSYFWEHQAELTDWIGRFPTDLALRDADDETLTRLTELASSKRSPSLSLLTKVLHRKRPELIPLVDRELLELYRPITGERGATAAWPALLPTLREDLAGPNSIILAIMNVELENQLGRGLSHLRLADIVIWMRSR